MEKKTRMDVLYQIVDMAASMVEATICLFFVSVFLEGEGMKKHLIGTAAVNVLTAIMNAVTMQINVYSLIRSLAFVSILLGTQFWMYRREWAKIVTLTIVYILFIALVDYSTVALMTYCFRQEFNYFQDMTLFRIVGTAISKVLLLLLVLLLYWKSPEMKQLKKSYLYLLTVISGSIFCFAVYVFQNFMDRNQIFGSEVLIFSLLLAVEVLFFLFFAVTADSQGRKEEIRMMDLHNEFLLRTLEEEKKNFEIWSGRLHDYKNLMLYIRELFLKKDYAKLGRVLEEQTGLLKQQYGYIITGYAGIDGIVNAKVLYARSQGVHVVCQLELPAGLKIDNERIAIVLGNLLDNAIRGVEDLPEKKIELSMKCSKDNLFIKIINNKMPEAINFSKSSKKNSRLHGIGIQSVQRQIKLMNGEFKLTQTEDSVMAVVVIYEIK